MIRPTDLPTLWDPQDLFFHAAIWAGIPVVLVAIVVWLLGLYQSAKGWVDLANKAGQGFQHGRGWLRGVTTFQQRAIARLMGFAVLVVGFAYMLAVILNAIIQLAVVNPQLLISSRILESTVVATQWSPASVWTIIAGVGGIGLLGLAGIADFEGLRKFVSFFGGTACALAWIAGVLLGADAVIGFFIFFISKSNDQDRPPMSLLVTEVITALLLLAVGVLLPKIGKASRDAFES